MTPKIGDVVQWESGGVLQLAMPLPIIWVSDDHQWVIVEGSKTGIPANELIYGDVTLSLAKFAIFPWGITHEDGPYNATRFRDEVLVPLLQKHTSVTVDLDGLAKVTASFLKEAFGGLIRKKILSPDDVGSKLKIRTAQDDLKVYCRLIHQFMLE